MAAPIRARGPTHGTDPNHSDPACNAAPANRCGDGAIRPNQPEERCRLDRAPWPCRGPRRQLAEARAARADLEDQLARLRAEYTIRIVSRKGELSGLWRIPKVNRTARNYYLVVEAIDKRGDIVKQTILNEETSKRETVDKWAVRVPREVLERVRADKADDGIINANRVAEKKRGFLEPDWRIPVSGGAITQW